MANIEGMIDGFVPKAIVTDKPVKADQPLPPRYVTAVCACCGFEDDGTHKQIEKKFKMSEDDGLVCNGCLNFFGLQVDGSMGFGSFNRGYTNLSPQKTKERLNEIKEAGYVILRRSMNFGGERTGLSLTLDLGDVFKVKRVSTDEKPTGDRKQIFKKFTVDIAFGPEVITLYAHEVLAVSWALLMQLRGEKDYVESFISSDDQEGYFKPSDEMRQSLIAIFGSR